MIRTVHASKHARRLLPLLVVLSLASPAAAAADGAILCRGSDSSGRRVDGTCEASQGSARRSCTTAGGSCTIADVAPGDWTVTFRPRSGSAVTRTVRVGSGGTVTVVLTVPAAPTLTLAPAGGTITTIGTTSATDGGATAATDAGTRTDGGTTADAGTSPPPDAGTTGTSTGGTTTTADAGTAVVPADGSSGGEARTITTIRPVLTASPTTSDPPDRSTGTRRAVQGRASDARGRLVDGTVTVSKDGVAIGRATTSGGRFALYDLPTGELTFTLRTPGGATGTATGRYLGEAITVNVTVR